MKDNEPINSLVAFNDIVSSLSKLDKEEQVRTLQAVVMLLDIKLDQDSPLVAKQSRKEEAKIASLPGFVVRDEISAKEFILEKEPRTDIERVACLAYYLTHYRNISHFGTIEISTLNIEAAQPKFTNAAQAVKNAVKSGLVVPSHKGKKQLSAMGEQYVQKLPDREAVREVLVKMKRKRIVKTVKNTKSIQNNEHNINGSNNAS